MTWRDDGPDEEWVDDEVDEDDTDAELLTCPSCRRAVHEDTQQCPHCGNWITPVDRSGSWKGTVWLVAAVLLVLVLSGILLL